MSQTKRWTLLSLFAATLFALPLFAQERLTPEAARLNRWFEEASAEFDVPVALLQAIAYTESGWRQLEPAAHDHDAVGNALERDGGHGTPAEAVHDGPPPAFGVMGLHDDAHFGYSLREAAALIGATPAELRENARLNIRGAAALLHKLSGGATRSTPLESWEPAVAVFSGIPEPAVAEMYTYGVFNAMLSGRDEARFRVAQREVDLTRVYGAEKLRVLSAPRLTIDVPAFDDSARDGIGTDSTDYGPAIWDPAASCNYSARTVAATHTTVHTIQGTYAGAISWFKNCSASVSAHYVVRSSDGQITQMVREADKAWHVGSENGYTVGIEHEGYVSDPARWYTDAMYNASALLARDICDSKGVPRKVYNGSLGWNAVLTDKTAAYVKGHVNYPNQSHTDPGSGWNWSKYASLVAPPTYSRIVDNTTAGRFTASANWAVSTYSTQRYGTDYLYANPQAISDSAWYQFDIPATGSYEVYVWYPANAGYNASTPYVVVTSSGNVTRVVNQQANGGMWVSIGIHHLNAGDYNAVGVSRWTSGAGYVIADAVRIVAR